MSIFVNTSFLFTCDGGDCWQISLRARKLILQTQTQIFFQQNLSMYNIMNSIIYTYKADGDMETTLNELPSNAAMHSQLFNAAVLAFK